MADNAADVIWSVSALAGTTMQHAKHAKATVTAAKRVIERSRNWAFNVTFDWKVQQVV
ncbi:hypothetical protein [Aestuariivirga sp.]|uniref:hypothetical protein n=1 Tax=Aestuariivirga sp. TaxID=2650926 RepID=UPI0039E52919